MHSFSTPTPTPTPTRYAVTCCLAAASLVLAAAIDSGLNTAPGAHPTATSDAAPALADVKLVGVAIGADAQRLARVSINGLAGGLVRPGDLLAGDYKVVAIDESSLTYRRGAQEVRVAVQDDARAAPLLAQPEAAAAGTAAVPAGTAAQAATGNEAFKQVVAQKMTGTKRSTAGQ